MAAVNDKPVNGSGAHHHGHGDSDSDDDDPSKLRPVHIEQDVREMERRKRVEAVMSSKLFREELEKVVSDSMRNDADGLSAMFAEMTTKPQAAVKGGQSAHMPIFFISTLIRQLERREYRIFTCISPPHTFQTQNFGKGNFLYVDVYSASQFSEGKKIKKGLYA
jgi:hypothetical protein